ncbi:CGNR zinc finger domain-containing protein [Streptomyces sp. NPDC008222]|uniref:CGNR zinc finger domain-containing protein n=1 Tax=Streptomyces sp. NPDC008222 TaxID=3364820 RepID=UPI0036E67787
MEDSAGRTPGTRVTARLRELRFDAGSLSLNLIATVGRRPASPVERLDGVERLRSWCAGVGLLLRGEDATPQTVESLHALRAAAHDITTAVLHGRPAQPGAVELVNRRAQTEPPAPRLSLTASGVHVDGRCAHLSADALQSLIARDLIALLGDPDRCSRLRECDSEICRMIYLDIGRGWPRRWCSMQRCGNSAKAARHRRRKAGALGGPEERSA